MATWLPFIKRSRAQFTCPSWFSAGAKRLINIILILPLDPFCPEACEGTKVAAVARWGATAADVLTCQCCIWCDLKSNGLSGQIPDEIGDCSSLRMLTKYFNFYDEVCGSFHNMGLQ